MVHIKSIFILFFLLIVTPVYAANHIYPEAVYQNKWCKMVHGQTEVVLPDKTRVDCLTKNYAIEFDFAPKWAEGLGQALHYARMTGKKPAIVLIIEKPSDFVYYYRIKPITEEYNIKLWYYKNPLYSSPIKK